MRLYNFYFCAFRQAVNTVGYDPITCGQPGGDHYFLAILNTWFNQMFAHFILAVQHPDKMALIAHLQGGRWDHHGVLFRVDQHAGVNELVRE